MNAARWAQPHTGHVFEIKIVAVREDPCHNCGLGRVCGCYSNMLHPKYEMWGFTCAAAGSCLFTGSGVIQVQIFFIFLTRPKRAHDLIANRFVAIPDLCEPAILRAGHTHIQFAYMWNPALREVKGSDASVHWQFVARIYKMVIVQRLMVLRCAFSHLSTVSLDPCSLCTVSSYTCQAFLASTDLTGSTWKIKKKNHIKNAILFYWLQIFFLSRSVVNPY